MLSILKHCYISYSVFSLGTFCVEADTQLFLRGSRYATFSAWKPIRNFFCRYATSTSATLLQGISKYVFLIANNESLHYFYIKPSCSADTLITRQATKFVCLAFKHFSVYANFHSGKRSKLFFVYVHSVAKRSLVLSFTLILTESYMKCCWVWFQIMENNVCFPGVAKIRNITLRILEIFFCKATVKTAAIFLR